MDVGVTWYTDAKGAPARLGRLQTSYLAQPPVVEEKRGRLELEPQVCHTLEDLRGAKPFADLVPCGGEDGSKPVRGASSAAAVPRRERCPRAASCALCRSSTVIRVDVPARGVGNGVSSSGYGSGHGCHGHGLGLSSRSFRHLTTARGGPTRFPKQPVYRCGYSCCMSLLPPLFMLDGYTDA